MTNRERNTGFAARGSGGIALSAICSLSGALHTVHQLTLNAAKTRPEWSGALGRSH